MDLERKAALITGGAMGMGKGFAEALVKSGCKVIVFSFDCTIGYKASFCNTLQAILTPFPKKIY